MKISFLLGYTSYNKLMTNQILYQCFILHSDINSTLEPHFQSELISLLSFLPATSFSNFLIKSLTLFYFLNDIDLDEFALKELLFFTVSILSTFIKTVL